MPVTINDLLIGGRIRLDKARIDDAGLCVRLILQHLMKMTASQLQLNRHERVSDEITHQFYGLIEKRAGHYPLQYLIGEVEFYDIKLKIDDRVLIPRPETEILVERVIELLKPVKSPKILDIGTGSGNIAIALAANLNNASVTAVDISPEALNLAGENALINRVNDKVSFIQADCLEADFWNTIGKFDAVVSNPPYVDIRDFATLQPEIRDYEPRVALINERGPLIFFETITGNISRVLNEHGLLCFEVGAAQSREVELIFKKYLPDCEIRVIGDLNNIERIVIAIL